jgi:hypothetical protein
VIDNESEQHVNVDAPNNGETSIHDASDTFKHERSFDESERKQRQKTPRQFLLPGTHAKEMQVRRMEDANLCVENVME